MLVWQPGPNANSLTEKKIESICIVQSIQNLSPNLASFIKMSKEKIKTYAHTSSSVSDATGTNCNDATGVQSLKQASQATKCVKQSASDISPCEEVGRSSNLLKRNREDADFGGVGNYYTMLLENVEKELSPLTIIEFIRRQTSITGQAYVLPSLSSERYSRSVIVLDFQKDLEDLCGFLNNPDHFIVSSKGRPWVVAKNFSRHDIFRASSIGTPMFASQRILQNGNCWNGDELKVVRSGTEEYKTAKELRDLLQWGYPEAGEVLKQYSVPEAGEVLKQYSVPDWPLLAIYLISEASLQKSSRWSNYISALPRQPYSLLYWTRAELDRYLEASQIRERVIERITNVIGTYNDLRLRIFSKYPDIFPEEVFNLEMFKWSFSIRFSRLVWLPSMGGRVALVPWAYMLNHNCEVETFWIMTNPLRELHLLLIGSISQGTNPSDSVELSLSLKKPDKCYKEKLEALRKHELSVSQCFLIQITGWPLELMAYAYLAVNPLTSNKTIVKKDMKYPEIKEQALQFVLDSCETSISKYSKFLQASGSMDLDITSPKQLN
ncbi:hypothetical protein Q3G72_027812 [Acer saccharum]|nr:hypothetical protein Q3G72_027812 [Acer saccharum]